METEQLLRNLRADVLELMEIEIMQARFFMFMLVVILIAACSVAPERSVETPTSAVVVRTTTPFPHCDPETKDEKA